MTAKLDRSAGEGIIARGSSGSGAAIVTRGGSWMVAARFARTSITILGMVALARLLTPADFGVVAITTTATILSLVIIEGVIDFPALRHDNLSRDAVQSMIWTALLLIAPFATILFSAAPMIEAALNITHLGVALRGILPVFFLQVFFMGGSAVLRRQHRFKQAAIIAVASVGIYMALAVALAFLRFGIWSIIIAQNVAMLLTALALARAARLSLRWPQRFTLAAVGRVGAYGAASRILAWFWSSVDTIAVAATLGPAATGLYTRAYNISVQIKEPFSALDAPTRQALIAVSNRDGDVGPQAAMMLRLITLATSGAAAICAVLREPLVMILLGNQWRASAPVLAILILGLPARIALMFFDGLASAAGSMPNMMLRHGVLCVVVGGGVFFAAPYGMAMVAVVVCVSLYLALLLPAHASERVATGGRLALLGAMLPGLAFGAGLLMFGEVVLLPWVGDNRLLTIAAMLGAGALAASLAAVAMPGRWLPVAFRVRRAALLSGRVFARA